MSPFAYNESAAQEWLPLEKSEAIKKGFRWLEKKDRDYKITLTTDKLPQTISEVSDDIMKEVISCAHNSKCNDNCTTAFKIVENELRLYRIMNIPLPVLCPNCRHYERLKLRNPTTLWHRKCMNPSTSSGRACTNEFETSYAPDRPEIVYCEACYQKEVA